MQVLQSDTIIAENYIISGCLAVGSNSTVYSCYHREFPRQPLVIKILNTSLDSQNNDSLRFIQGISASAKINHPNVIRTYAYVRSADLAGYVMEHIEGKTLAQLLDSGYKVSLKETIKILRQ
ncbi:MAG: protein kinase, partial [Bdellovibrionales bacterium]|nr:protein kinase [Bdellovibrionales bacterium]